MTMFPQRHFGEGRPAHMRREARLAEGRRASPWLANVGILNDYVRIPFANGSSFASQFLYRELEARGRRVSVVGPNDPDASPDEMPPNHLMLRSVALRAHPGVHLAFPRGDDLAKLRAQKLDLMLGQTCSGLMDAGVWLRETDGVPLVMVHTVHLPSVYNTVLPDALDRSSAVHAMFQHGLVPFAEAQTVNAYNRGDGLVVLSKPFESYWRDRGVTVPIHVIPRAIDPRVFGREATRDPFDPRTTRGYRLLVVCRHVREKGVDRLLSLLARHVFESDRRLTITLVGDGPDHDTFRARAKALGIADRCFFEGEQPLVSMADWYGHADLFVYTSLSETYGQVVSEALYAGVPVVAFDDAMGVAGQVSPGVDGMLVPLGSDAGVADEAFGSAVLTLVADTERRRAYSEAARRLARARCDSKVCIDRYFGAFEAARTHLATTWKPRAFAPTPLVPLFRWAGIHSLLAGMGCLREPVTVNRLHAKTPAWRLHRAG